MKSVLKKSFFCTICSFYFVTLCQGQIELPSGKNAVIVLTYDDGMQTHLTNAIPQLDNAGLKGTFFINNINGRNDAMAWESAALNGHELGNHTLFHPCPLSFGWNSRVATDNYTVSQILKEVEATAIQLDIVDKQEGIRTFAYPCNNTKVGAEDYRNELIASGFVKYARGGGDENSILIDPSDVNFKEMASYPIVENSTFEEIKPFIKEVLKKNGIGILQFHGIGGEWIQVSSETHIQVLQFLKSNASIWVPTFKELMVYLDKKGYSQSK